MKTPVQTLLSEIEELQKRYTESFATTDDIKALQGVERCIELKMKIYCINGKQPPMECETNPEIAIDLAKLSLTTLKEILDATSNNE